MGTNYYRIPTEEEMTRRAEKLAQAIIEMDMSPMAIHQNFSIDNQHSFDGFNPWDEFTDGVNVHLGKRSMGWKFCWNFNDMNFYKDKTELLVFIRSGRIINEYGAEQDTEEFIKMALAWGEPNGMSYDMNYVRKELSKNPSFHWSADYFNRSIDGLRVSTSTDFC